jgi:hypothetical protein
MEAVSVYYGRFPSNGPRVFVSQNEDNDESIHGTKWGDVQGVKGPTRMRRDFPVDSGSSLTLQEKHHLKFSVLSDSGNGGWRGHPVVRRGGLYETVGTRDGTQMDRRNLLASQ